MLLYLFHPFIGRGSSHVVPPSAVSCFPGFLPAIEACSLEWKNLELGIVPEEKSRQVQHPLTLRCARMYCPEPRTDAENENIMAPLERFVLFLYILIVLNFALCM